MFSFLSPRSWGMLRVLCCDMALLGCTVAVLAAVQGCFGDDSISSRGAEGGRIGWGGLEHSALCDWPRVLSTWFRSKHIFRPAQNRSKDSKPFGGVTFCRLSITPLGRPLVPSSCQRFSISEKTKQVKVKGHYIPHTCATNHILQYSQISHIPYVTCF